MDNKNEILLKNVRLLSVMGDHERGMMPQTEAPLPSVEEVKRIIQIVKSIIFTDYFHKRQADERMRSYIIGVNMESRKYCQLSTKIEKIVAKRKRKRDTSPPFSSSNNSSRSSMVILLSFAIL